MAVDGEQVTLREMAFYIAYEEGSMEDAAIIYNPDNTDEYWQPVYQSYVPAGAGETDSGGYDHS